MMWNGATPAAQRALAAALLILANFFLAPAPLRAQDAADDAISVATRPRADQTSSLLVKVDESIGGSSVTEIVIESAADWSEAVASVLPDGWSFEQVAGGVRLFGPPLAETGFFRIDLAAGTLIQQVQTRVLAGGQALLSQSLAVPSLGPVEIIDKLDGLLALPARLSPGEVIQFSPLDMARTPAGGVWTIAGVEAELVPGSEPPRYAVRLPADLSRDAVVSVTYKDPYGDQVVDAVADVRIVPAASMAADQAARLTACTPRAFRDRVICVCGWFPDEASWQGLTLDGRPLTPLGGSRTSVMVRIPADVAPGLHTITGAAAAGFEGEGIPIVVLAVRGSVDRERLLRGESTPLRFVVEGTEEVLSIKITNRTPSIISIGGGEQQDVVTSGGTPNELRPELNVRGISPGPFTIHYILDEDPCPCANDPGTVVARDDPGPTRTREQPPLDTTRVRIPRDSTSVPGPPGQPPGGPPPSRPEELPELCCGLAGGVLSYPITSDFLEPPEEQFARHDAAMAAQNVHLPDGAFFHARADLHVESVGFPFVFRRQYRSNVKTTSGGWIGHGWDLNVKRIVPIARKLANGLFVEVIGVDKPSLYLYDGDGRGDRYAEAAPGAWRTVSNYGSSFRAFVTAYASPPGAFHEIQRYVLANPSDHPFIEHPNVDRAHGEAIFYVLREPDGNLWIFNCRGMLIYHDDRHGNRMTYIYQGRLNPLTQNPMLSKVIDTADRAYTFETITIDQATVFTNIDCKLVKGPLPIPRFKQITDFTGRHVVLNYELSDSRPVLETVRQEFGLHHMSVAYATTPRGDYFLLDSIHNPREFRGGRAYVRNEYEENPDGGYRIASQLHGDATYRLAYEGKEKRVVTDPNGNVHEHLLEKKAGGYVRRQLTVRGAAPATPVADRVDRGPWITRYVHNDATQQTEYVDAKGNVMQFVHDDSNRPVTLGPVRDWVERNLTYANNLAKGNLLSVIWTSNDGRDEVKSLREVRTYEPLFNQLLTETDPRGTTFTYKYDYDAGSGYNGVAVELAYPPLTRPEGGPLAGLTERFTYTPEGQLWTHVHTHGSTTTYQYQPKTGYLTGIITPSGAETYEVDRRGNVTTETSGTGTVTRFDVDDRDLTVARVDDVNGFANRTSFKYDPNGNVVEEHFEIQDNFAPAAVSGTPRLTVASPTAMKRVLTYDLIDRVTAEEFSGNSVRSRTTWRYDGNGNVLETVSPAPAGEITERHEYDGRDLPVRVIDAAGTTEERVTVVDYDLVGNMISVEEPGNVTTTYDHDGFDRQIEHGDAMGGSRRVWLDGNGNVIREEVGGSKGLADGSNGILFSAEYQYDELNNLIRERVARLDGSNTFAERRWIFGRTLQPERMIAPNGGVTRYEYDADARLSAQTDPVGNRTTFEYDASHNVTVLAEEDVEHVTGTDGKTGSSRATYTTRVEYDALNRPVRRVLPGGLATRLYFDSRSRLRAAIDDDGRLTQSLYDPLGRLVEMRTPNDTVRYRYGGTDDAISITSRSAKQRVDYDVLGRENAIHDDRRRTSTTFRYDDASRTIHVSLPSGDMVRTRHSPLGVPVEVTVQYGSSGPDHRTTMETYRHDGLGRITHAQVGPPGLGNSVTTTYDGLDQVLEEHQTFDGRRHIVRMRHAPDFSGSTLYYPAAAGPYEVTTRNDALGRAIAVTAGGLTTGYHYSGTDRLAARTTGDGRIRTEIAYDESRRAIGTRLLDAILNRSISSSTMSYEANTPVDRREVRRDPNTTKLLFSSGTTFTYDRQARLSRVESRMVRNEAPAVQTTQRSFLRTIGNTQETLEATFAEGTRPDESPTRVRWSRTTRDARSAIQQVETKILRESKLRQLALDGNPDRDAAALFDAASNTVDLGETRRFNHDRAGNLSEDGRFRYDYDYQGRVIRVEDLWAEKRNMNLAVNYYFDALGRRVAQYFEARPAEQLEIHKLRNTRYVYSGTQVIAELDESKPAAPALLARYVPGAGGNEILRMDRREDEGVTQPLRGYYVHEDLSGSITHLHAAEAGTDIRGIALFRNYQGDDLSGVREDRYVEGTTTRIPYVARSARYDAFSNLVYNESTGVSIADYASTPELDHQLYLLENWDAILRTTQARYPTPPVIRAMQLAMGGVFLVGLVPAALAAGPGLLVMGKAGLSQVAFSAGVSSVMSSYENWSLTFDYSLEQAASDFALGAVTGGASRLFGGMAALSAPQFGRAAGFAAAAAETSLETAIDVAFFGDDFTGALVANVMAAGIGALPGNSFTAGTRVLTEDGARAIEEIKVGQRVWSRSAVTGEIGLKAVDRTSVMPAPVLIHLQYRPRERVAHSAGGRGGHRSSSSGDGASDGEGDEDPELEPPAPAEAGAGRTRTLSGTPEHPFWSVTRGDWVQLAELQPGEELLLYGGSAATVESVDLHVGRDDPVSAAHNLGVSDWHTFFVLPAAHAEPDSALIDIAAAVWVHNGGPRNTVRYRVEGSRFGQKKKPKVEPSTHLRGQVKKLGGVYTAALKAMRRMEKSHLNRGKQKSTVNRSAEALGEAGAIDAIKQKLGTGAPIYKGRNNNTVDLVFKIEPNEYIVVEAKGGLSHKLGDRSIGTRRAVQGSPAYLEATLTSMRARKRMPDTEIDEMLAALKNPTEGGPRIRYMLVFTQVPRSLKMDSKGYAVKMWEFQL